PQGIDIIIDRCYRDVMFNSGMPVNDHVHIMEKRTSSFGIYVHSEFLCRLHDLLALLAAWLIVTFNRNRSKGFGPSQGRSRIIQAVDIGFEISFGTAKDNPC